MRLSVDNAVVPQKCQQYLYCIHVYVKQQLNVIVWKIKFVFEPPFAGFIPIGIVIKCGLK